ncbi:DUF6686 family protein [Polaribacter reichenbachii]
MLIFSLEEIEDLKTLLLLKENNTEEFLNLTEIDYPLILN